MCEELSYQVINIPISAMTSFRHKYKYEICTCKKTYTKQK